MRQELVQEARAERPVCGLRATPHGYGWSKRGENAYRCVLDVACGRDVRSEGELYAILSELGVEGLYPAIRRIDCWDGTDADLDAVREFGDLLGVEVSA